MIKNSAIVINPLGHFLKKVRAKNAWSQEEFATVSGVSTRTLQRIEGGEKANIETLRAIAAALQTEVTTLLPWNDLMAEEDFEKMQAQTQEQLQKELAQFEKEMNVLPRVRNGKELLAILASVQIFNTDHPNPASEEEASAVADLLSYVRDYGDIHRDLEPQQQMEMILAVTRCIGTIEALGLAVFAGRLRGHVVLPGPSGDIAPLRMRQAGVYICRTSDIMTVTDEQGREAFRFRIPYGPVNF